MSGALPFPTQAPVLPRGHLDLHQGLWGTSLCMTFRGLEKRRGWMGLPPVRVGREVDPNLGVGTGVGGSHRADVVIEDLFSEPDNVQTLAGVFSILERQGRKVPRPLACRWGKGGSERLGSSLKLSPLVSTWHSLISDPGVSNSTLDPLAT